MRFQSAVINPEVVWYGSLPTMIRQNGLKLGGRRAPVSVALGYHAQQCGQRWWGIRVGRFRLAYRTRGDASPTTATHDDGGLWWPWQTGRTFAGLGL